MLDALSLSLKKHACTYVHSLSLKHTLSLYANVTIRSDTTVYNVVNENFRGKNLQKNKTKKLLSFHLNTTDLFPFHK